MLASAPCPVRRGRRPLELVKRVRLVQRHRRAARVGLDAADVVRLQRREAGRQLGELALELAADLGVGCFGALGYCTCVCVCVCVQACEGFPYLVGGNG